MNVLQLFLNAVVMSLEWSRYTDGGSECVIMRERPHLIFAADGVTPMALSTAAMHGPPVIPGTFAQNRTSFTLVQDLNQH